MVQTTRLLSTGAIALLHFTASSSAQNGATDEGQCPEYLEPVSRGDYNSSGSLRFSFEGQDEWQLTMTLEESLQSRGSEGETTSAYHLSSYISVPESFVGSDAGNETRVCTYWMRGRNATASEGNATQSCDQILSDECREALQEISNVSPGDSRCPLADPKEIEEACGGMFWIISGTPRNFSSPECALDSIPGIDVPSDSLTFYTLWGSLEEADELPASGDPEFQRYDLHVQQTVPVFISAILPPGEGETHWHYEKHVLCVAPNDVRDGSRVPEEGSMPEDGSEDGTDDGTENGSEPRRASVFMAVAMSLALAVLLV